MTPEKYAKEFLVDYLESSQDEFNDNFDDVARERIDDSFENFEVNNRNVKAAINKKLKDIISFVKTIAF